VYEEEKQTMISGRGFATTLNNRVTAARTNTISRWEKEGPGELNALILVKWKKRKRGEKEKGGGSEGK